LATGYTGIDPTRKKNHQLPDPLLDNASSLSFYFTRLNQALGMSTYAPVEEEILLVLKRFRMFLNWHTEIPGYCKGREQTKEEQLNCRERVCQGMAMHRRMNWQNWCPFFQELRRLEFPVTVIIWINNPETSTEELWWRTPRSVNHHSIFYKSISSFFFKSIIHAWKERIVSGCMN
jgi:hypothetical protein